MSEKAKRQRLSRAAQKLEEARNAINAEQEKNAINGANDEAHRSKDEAPKRKQPIRIPPFLDREIVQQLITDPREKELLWNRLRHRKFSRKRKSISFKNIDMDT